MEDFLLKELKVNGTDVCKLQSEPLSENYGYLHYTKPDDIILCMNWLNNKCKDIIKE